ncbi:nickel/cobalt transporter [Chroococcidiopsis sp. TS-821]|uniref:nickel/cobalt transporter n=1 Tax=Chroococcidiopsis sp. TS-821 TaxID=1378066 RepID=UPI000CEEE4F2|nr:sulfite exporter TauE/SafE family protein [Chroococcidiopsis sp. TS-821]PPS41008.1 ABC transporter permease [Chroococcidiopsis sp. TS-821]
MKTKWHKFKFGIILVSLLLVLLPTASRAHWTDVAVAEIVVGETQTQVTLTLPTGLVTMADDNQDGQLSTAEVHTHQAKLEKFLGNRFRLTNANHQQGILTVAPLATKIPSIQATATTHTTLQLTYNWTSPVQGLKIDYNLFLPEAPEARCFATIFNAGQTQNYIFSPDNRQLSLMPSVIPLKGSFLAAIAGAIVWGAMHAMSPGHGKTIVGAYLMGSRATVYHAIFLGLTTTITHTIGVFALGLASLFASRLIAPDLLYPWLSLLSGLMVVFIGINLFWHRLRHVQQQRSPAHTHKHHHHSHLPTTASLHWRSLFALGISGGLVPCPAALVLLLSAIALGHISWGLVLVLAFSLGLAGVLTALGLLLIYAQGLFKKLPTQVGLLKILPVVSAATIAIIGLGITTQALIQLEVVI